MLKFTLDMNCLIDVEEDRPSARFVRALLESATAGEADVAMVAASASERQRSGSCMIGPEQLEMRMNRSGFGHIKLLPAPGEWGISFWDLSDWMDSETIAQLSRIYCALFPNDPEHWEEFAEHHQADPSVHQGKEWNSWKNRVLDTDTYWRHEFDGRDVFVTGDRNFKKRLHGNPNFPNARICTPSEAAQILIIDDEANDRA